MKHIGNRRHKFLSIIITACLIMPEIPSTALAITYSNTRSFLAPPGSGNLINHSLNADLNVKGKQTPASIPESLDIMRQRRKYISPPISVIENRERAKLNVYKIPSDKLSPKTIRLIRNVIHEEARDFQDSGADMLHIDIRDEEFIRRFIRSKEKDKRDVPGSNTSLITAGFIKQLNRDVHLQKDIHLLCCKKPNGVVCEKYLKSLAQIENVRSISIQMCAFNEKTLIKYLIWKQA